MRTSMHLTSQTAQGHSLHPSHSGDALPSCLPWAYLLFTKSTCLGPDKTERQASADSPAAPGHWVPLCTEGRPSTRPTQHSGLTRPLSEQVPKAARKSLNLNYVHSEVI